LYWVPDNVDIEGKLHGSFFLKSSNYVVEEELDYIVFSNSSTGELLRTGHQWLTSVILVTWEDEIG
jgi:hypothetical protein